MEKRPFEESIPIWEKATGRVGQRGNIVEDRELGVAVGVRASSVVADGLVTEAVFVALAEARCSWRLRRLFVFRGHSFCRRTEKATNSLSAR